MRHIYMLHKNLFDGFTSFQLVLVILNYLLACICAFEPMPSIVISVFNLNCTQQYVISVSYLYN